MSDEDIYGGEVLLNRELVPGRYLDIEAGRDESGEEVVLTDVVVSEEGVSYTYTYPGREYPEEGRVETEALDRSSALILLEEHGNIIDEVPA